MNILIWLLAGGAVGWIACSVLNLNAARGLMVSAIIGVLAAFVGGYLLAPAFGVGVDETGGFSAFALLVASASAIAALTIADMLYERFEF
jgi:uncharacterized membrane protein YeaQ/YmgE (transglycosylase-associated protein family)